MQKPYQIILEVCASFTYFGIGMPFIFKYLFRPKKFKKEPYDDFEISSKDNLVRICTLYALPHTISKERNKSVTLYTFINRRLN